MPVMWVALCLAHIRSFIMLTNATIIITAVLAKRLCCLFQLESFWTTYLAVNTNQRP